MSSKKVVLAYSGGLDTSVIAKWLSEKGFEVIAVTVDVGQNEDLSLNEKALKSGAKKFYIANAKDEFVASGVFQCIKAEAKYEGKYLLGTSIARPFIMKKIVEIARKEKTTNIAHGATGKGNDQCRFEFTVHALMPEAVVIAPWRIKEFREVIPGRKEAIEYAKKYAIPIEATLEKPWSTDTNIAHRSHEAGLLEDPCFEHSCQMYKMVKPVEQTPDKPAFVLIGFKDGFAVSINGKKMSPVQLLDFLNKLGGEHGVGVVDMVENRFVGMKSRGVYEAPGVTILHAAHRDLEGITMNRDLMHLRDSLIPRYSELVYYGFWCSRELQALNAFIDSAQKGITGEVKVKLFKGNCFPVARKSKVSLYNENISTMEKGGAYNQDDATGFLNITSLPLKIQVRVNKKIGVKFF